MSNAEEYFGSKSESMSRVGRDPDSMTPDFSVFDTVPEFKTRFIEIVQQATDANNAAANELLGPDGSDPDSKYFAAMLQISEEKEQAISDLCKELGIADAEMWGHVAALAGAHFADLYRNQHAEEWEIGGEGKETEDV